MARSFYYLLPPGSIPDTPRVLQRVRIEGQPGIYVVLRLDTGRFAADLMLTTGKHEIEENVPFFAIEPLTTKAAEIEQSEPIETKDATAPG